MKESDNIEGMRDDETQILPVIEESQYTDKLRNPVLSVFMRVCSLELKKFMRDWRMCSDTQRMRIIDRERKYMEEMRYNIYEGIDIENDSNDNADVEVEINIRK